MSDRSVPVFYVRVKPPSPVPHASTSAAVEVEVALRECKKAEATAAKLASQIANDPAPSPQLQATYEKALADMQRWGAEHKRAQSKAASCPEPPPPADPPPTDLDLSDRVTQLLFEDDEKKVDLLKLTLDNRDLVLLDSPIMDKGTVLIASWGYPGNMAEPRECVVQKVTGSLSLSVEAHDKGVLLNKEARTRTFENKTRSEIAEAIAGENGFGPERRFIDPTETRYEVVAQSSTDAQLLKKLADLEGFEFYVDWDGLHWHARKMDQKPIRVLQYYLPPDVGDIETWSLDNDITNKPGAVTAKGRDPVERKDVSHTASDSSTPRTTLATQPEAASAPPPTTIVVDPKTGAYTPTQAPPKTPATAPGASSTATSSGAASGDVRHTTETSEGGVKSEAEGIYVRTQQATVGLKVNIVGDPRLCAKTIVDVRGIGQRFSGKYYVGTSKHNVSTSSYKTELTCKRDGTNKAPAGASTGESAAKPNTKQPDEKADKGTAPPPLVAVTTVDPKTGEYKTSYVPAKG